MKLAIIIPTLARPILSQVLDSLLSQIKQNNLDSKVHIYVGYDGKPSDKQFSSFKEKYFNSCLTFLYTDSPKSGASNARNICLEKAVHTADLISFLGDDTVPEKNWILKTLEWHTLNPQPNQAVFGRVFWSPDIINDPLHIWLDGHIQFDFTRLDKGHKPSWKHFTTSNLSLKSSLLLSPKNFFNTDFKGWGFEDGELGYRLHIQKSIKISYDPTIKVVHYHPQNFQKTLQNLHNARKNALLFQQIHPEQKIVPTGLKKLILTTLSLLLLPIPQFISQKSYWWSRSKLVWLGYKFPLADQ